MSAPHEQGALGPESKLGTLAVPDGWILVPEEATGEMWRAGQEADEHPGDSYGAVWRAMIYARPRASVLLTPFPASAPASGAERMTAAREAERAAKAKALIPPAGSEERDFWIEAAIQHGFEETSGGEVLAEYDPPAFFATQDEVLALMASARQQGRDDAALSSLSRWACNGDPEQPSPSAPGQPIATAPVNEEVFVYCGEMRFRAKLVLGASMTMDEEPCNQWQATHEGEHPPCWSDGCCWASNEDENASLQPTHWSPTTPGPATPPGVPDGLTAAEWRLGISAALEGLRNTAASLPELHEAQSPIAAAVGILQAVDSTIPPGVPDSVREAVARLDKIRAEESESFQNGGGLRLHRIIPQQSHAEALALEYVRILLDTHPAGQSAGSGAEGSSPRPWTFDPSHNEVATQIYDATGVSICEFWSDKPNRDADATLIVAAVNAAPVSTRTGDEGTEEIRAAIKAYGEAERRAGYEAGNREEAAGERARNEAADKMDAVQAALFDFAARPAAPEAQGAWSFDMEAAPREHGRELLGWGRLRGSAPMRAIMTWFDAGGDFNGKTGWWTVASLPFEPIAFQLLPAPPSSSGQGGSK